MKNRYYVLLAAIISLCLAGAAGAEVALSVDDFLPPVQAKSSEEAAELLQVKAPDKVEIVQESEDGEVVRAESAQDAFNVVVDQKKVGCVRAEFGSGFGWVATGMGTYERMEDVVASRISKRNAYVTAYMMARRSWPGPSAISLSGGRPRCATRCCWSARRTTR